ncbi:MAG: hypothetical protein GYA55_10425 [SAR324 cluster bacterium]|uniref:Uncharacterized protein n=1 Tax=SAR324 cluster bacterium TaxID=2024889 RepID=A0A7X9FTE1_9DELT|nr:hypothetical protein [SAR324 cluster bacterium]
MNDEEDEFINLLLGMWVSGLLDEFLREWSITAPDPDNLDSSDPLYMYEDQKDRDED